MGFKSFKSVESEKVVTLPNLLTLGRAVGGVALGAGMATHNVDPTTAFWATAALVASDAEGSAITLTNRFPRLQKRLRIMASSIGRVFDPIADKAFAMSVFVGGLMNETIPVEHGAPVLFTEAVTAITAGIAAKKMEDEPQVSAVGTASMLARSALLGSDLGAAAVEPGSFHDALVITGGVSAGTAFVLGALSCFDIARQARAAGVPEAA